MSLDGVVSDPRSWANPYFDEDATRRSLERLMEVRAMVMGRGTYEYFAPAWSQGEGPYLERINALPKYVFSSTLTAVDWNNAELVTGDAATVVADLKREDDGDLVIYGYGGLAQSLLEQSLVDELGFWVHPVLLGDGKPAFRPGERTELRLGEVTSRPTGVVEITYYPQAKEA